MIILLWEMETTSYEPGAVNGVERSISDLRTRDAIRGYLRGLAQQLGVKEDDEWLARELDRRDQLAHLRTSFYVPTIGDLVDEKERDAGCDATEDCIYLCGNSLGLQPKGVQDLVSAALNHWEKKGVKGHFTGQYPWYSISEDVSRGIAPLVGGLEDEVIVMNSLTVNVHLGMVPFYRPFGQRCKILMEEQPFPSDLYAVESQVRWHGYDPATTIIFAKIREGEQVWRDEDIVRQIEEEGDSIALVFLSGIHFASGHYFDMKAITEAGHRKGCCVGWNLAHAVGNVELSLHDWGVDFACWCNYKYMNSGPGCIAGFFVHQKHANKPELPRLIGWWAHKGNSRMAMTNTLELSSGVQGFQISNPPVLECMALQASLRVFGTTSMAALTHKSRILTGYLEMLLEDGLGGGTRGEASPHIEVVTSPNPARRGCQLSIRTRNLRVSAVEKYICSRGVVIDFRPPDVMRVAPTPLYNSFSDVLHFVCILREALNQQQ